MPKARIAPTARITGGVALSRMSVAGGAGTVPRAAPLTGGAPTGVSAGDGRRGGETTLPGDARGGVLDDILPDLPCLAEPQTMRRRVCDFLSALPH
jgi:hypothetical protein